MMLFEHWLPPTLPPNDKKRFNEKRKSPYKSSIFTTSLSGKAEVCKTFIPGPIPGGASKKSRTRIACPALFGRATHEAHPAPRAKGVAGSGSHTPPEGRGACSPDAGRGYIRRRRNSDKVAQ